MFASFDGFNERLFTQDVNIDLVFYHNNRDFDNDTATQITELLYTYADSACNILNFCTRPTGPVCYILRKLHRRAFMIYSKFATLLERVSDENIVKFNYFDNEMLGQNLNPDRIRTLGCASLYNEQALIPLVQYDDRTDDLLISKFIVPSLDRLLTTSLPRHVAYPDPVDKSLRVTEFINDTTHDTIRHAIQLLYNDLMDICDTRQTLTIERDENGLNTFHHSHPYLHEICQIFDTHYYDWYNGYIHEHLPYAADIRAIISLSMSLSREVYIDPPNYPSSRTTTLTSKKI